MFNNDQITCVAPWSSIRIDTTGTYKYCDHSKEIDQSDLLPSQWFAGGQQVTAARKSIQEGNALPGCHQCYSNENNKFDSFRQRKNLHAAIHHGPHFKESVKQSPAFARMAHSTLATHRPAFIHVSLSNLCNLSCRMCTPNSSSQLTSIHKKINLISKDVPALIDWTIDSTKWNDFSQNLVLNNTDLICLHFMGGEPLYHSRFHELINTCVQQSKTDFHITFVTNGTVWRPELIDMLSNFKSVTVEISIENFHKTNDYVRNGSDYTVIKKNIVNLLATKTDNISVVLRPVPQALSIEHYDTLIDFALEHNLSIDANMLFDPPELAISTLPTEYKQKIVDKLSIKYSKLLTQHSDQFLVHLVRNQHHAHQTQQTAYHVKKIIRLLQQPEPENVEQLRCKFVNYNQQFDQVVGNRFHDYFVDLIDFYEKYNRN